MKHNNIIDLLQVRCNKQFGEDFIEYREYDYDIGKIHGEMDYGLKRIDGKYAIVFEVKSHDSYKGRAKAKQQINKDLRYFKKIEGVEKVFKFYVHSDHTDMNYDLERILQ